MNHMLFVKYFWNLLRQTLATAYGFLLHFLKTVVPLLGILSISFRAKNLRIFLHF